MPSTISFRVSDISPGEMYLLLRDSVLPRPVAWVSTIGETGATNLAPFSFFNVCSPSPPVLGFSCGPKGDAHDNTERFEKDTERNIRATREFVVNIVPERLTAPMIASADSLPYGESEFAHAGLVEAPSVAVRPPRVANVPVAFECTLRDIVELGTNHWIMGTVVHVHVDESVYLGERSGRRHRVDLLAAIETRPVGRLDRARYARLRDIDTHFRKDGPNG